MYCHDFFQDVCTKQYYTGIFLDITYSMHVYEHTKLLDIKPNITLHCMTFRYIKALRSITWNYSLSTFHSVAWHQVTLHFIHTYMIFLSIILNVTIHTYKIPHYLLILYHCIHWSPCYLDSSVHTVNSSNQNEKMIKHYTVTLPGHSTKALVPPATLGSSMGYHGMPQDAMGWHKMPWDASG